MYNLILNAIEEEINKCSRNGPRSSSGLINNRNSSKHLIPISKIEAQAILKFYKKHNKNKIEYGNLIDLDDGKFAYAKDIRGGKGSVRVPRLLGYDNYALLHNHPSEGGLSDGDIRNLLEERGENKVIATTPSGKVFVATLTDQGKYSKENGGLTSDTISKYYYKLHGIALNTSKDLIDEYDEWIKKYPTKEERKIKYKTEFAERYNKQIMELYGTGDDLYIVMDKYDIEELEDVIRGDSD